MARGLRMTEEAYAARQQRKVSSEINKAIAELAPQAQANAEATAALMREFAATAKPPKYRNVKTEVDGIKFDSKKEAARYVELRTLQQAGAISSLGCQKRYPLCVDGDLICTYVADFVYVPKGKFWEVVEDVKSDFTRKNAVYRIKKKLMKAIYDIDVVEV